MDWIEGILTAWKGHRKFAEWLVQQKNPKTIVDLGVDYGYSTFVFANALTNYNYNGIAYGIDLYADNMDVGGYQNRYEMVMHAKEQHNMNNLKIIRGDFTEESQKWEIPIDILHIDGDHTFDAVKSDFQNWSKFVEPDGIVLFHDVESFEPVRDFFRSIEGGYKMYFVHSAGLGIYTQNADLAKKIQENFPDVIPI